MYNNYVVGFAFNEDKTKLLLIQKTKPDWQAGQLNGIGGKIELYDLTPYEAMTREFSEESNLKTINEDWHLFGKITSSNFELYCFVGFFEQKFLETYKNLTEEEIFFIDVKDLYKNEFNGCIPNLKWLIPLCSEPNALKLYVQGKYF